MIRLELISSEDIKCAWLQELKRYAAVADDSQDSLLRSLLKRAALVVQEYADTSVLACSFRLYVSGWDIRTVQLYQTVSSVTKVTDENGFEVPYAHSGKLLTLMRNCKSVIVEYGTVVNEYEFERLSAVVIRYATALYDGQDKSELDKIIYEIC